MGERLISTERQSHLNQRKVKFIDESLFLPHSGFVRRNLDSHTDDEVPDT